MNRTQSFLTDDTGAVTVDWTVLAASVVGLGLGAVVAVRTGVISLGGDINSSLGGAEIAALMTDDTPGNGLNLADATGYRDQTFYFFTSAGVNNWYRNNVQNLSNADLMTALASRARNRDSEMAMGPNDAPSYGQPWGHTDMYNLTYWEAAYRGLL